MIIYRLLSPFVGLALLACGLWAMLRGQETFRDWLERLGGPKATRPTIWVHGASVGEMNAAKPVIIALSERSNVLVTVTTLTGRATVEAWGLPTVTARLAPLDWTWITRRLIRQSKITSLIIVENELWPNRILAAHQAGLPVLMINARMSASSARTWARFAGTALQILRPMALIAPQDADTADRLKNFGARAAHVAKPLNLKGLYEPNATPIPAQLRGFQRNRTLLAAATHAGEDAIVLQAFAKIQETEPDAQLIIAPRHPDRGDELAKLISAQGVSYTRRSTGDPPGASVYLADTLGEMHLWFRLAGAAFIGGSLVDKGGHTPFEPTAYGCPILHGLHVSNFADAYATLNAAQAALKVNDAASLAHATKAAWQDAEMGNRAKAALTQPDLAPLLAKIDAALDPSP